MYILNIVRAIEKMSVNEIRHFLFENYYKRVGFSKENSYYSMKHMVKKINVTCKQINRKKYLILIMLKNTNNHQSFIGQKNRKSVKQSEIINY